jgi:hypothetical protein
MLLGVCVFSWVGRVARAQELAVKCETPSISEQSIEPFKFDLVAAKATDVTVRVFDAEGAFVRVLAGGALHDEEKLAFEWDKKNADGRPVLPGVYTVRTEAGVSFSLDKSFAKQGVLVGPPFVSPQSISVDRKGDVYVLDVPKATLFKYHSDGSPANDWEKSNTITSPTAPIYASVALSDSGRIFMPEGLAGHSLAVFDAKTGQRELTIGQFFGDDPDWKIKPGGLGWPGFATVGNGRVYIACSGYSLLGAFDQNKPGCEGAYWRNGQMSNKIDSIGAAGDSDGRNGLYFCSASYHNAAELYKLIDTGDFCTFAFDLRQYKNPATGHDDTFAGIVGITSDRAGVLYVMMRPTQTLLKVVDTGSKFVVVAANGTKGRNAEKLQFQSPASIAVSPAGDAIYIAEDNAPLSLNRDADETDVGLARVTKYAIRYRSHGELKITVNP